MSRVLPALMNSICAIIHLYLVELYSAVLFLKDCMNRLSLQKL